MRAQFEARGPWRGINQDAQDPRQHFNWAYNADFSNGVAKQIAFRRAVGRPFPTPLDDLLTVIYIKHRDGMDRYVAVTRSKLYLVSANGRLIDATGSCNWLADAPSDVSWGHVTTDASEWLVLASRLRNNLFRLSSDNQVFTEFVAPRGGDSSGLRGGRVVTVFGDRLVFGGVRTALGEVPHAVGWYGIKGPFDYTLPTSGYMPLTDVPGRVTAFAHIQDFLAVFKSRGAYVLQKTFLPELPFAAIPRLHAIGVESPGHVVSIAQQSMLVFYSEATKRIYVWDMNKIEDISGPVWRELSSRSNPSLYYNEYTETLDVCYPDIVLRFSTKDGWWSAVDPDGSTTQLGALVMRFGLSIDELVGTIDEQTGRIDDYPAAEVVGSRCYVNGGGFSVEDKNAVGRTTFRTVPLVFPKPTTITSFEAYIRAPLNAVVMIRYKLDRDELWSEYITLEQGDTELGRYTHHFVETARVFEFEVAIEGSGCELVQWGVEVVGSRLQEDQVPGGSVLQQSGSGA